MKLVSAWLAIPFWQRVLAGFVLGALAGWLLGPAAQTWFGPLGTVYVNLIKMIAIPLVFFAVVSAVERWPDSARSWPWPDVPSSGSGSPRYWR